MIAFIVFAMITGAFSALGSLFITRLIVENNFQSYSEMAKKAGGKVMMGLSNFCVTFYAWGITICFQVILAKFVVQLLNDVCGMDLYDNRKDEIYNSTGKI